ncbi:MAG: hypothetical protein IJL06_00900 [Kiritimatiellae bacterium]|nr:hypothetical protein [Kiritimatiellia bacterium]
MKKRRPPLRRKYKNRNRSWDTRQNTFALTLKSSAAVVLLALAAIAWLLVRHSNESLADAIVREEARGRDLATELQRETAKWNAMRSPGNLRAVLLANGIAMNVPSPRQRVAMRGGGTRPAGAVATAGTAYAANR